MKVKQLVFMKTEGIQEKYLYNKKKIINDVILNS